MISSSMKIIILIHLRIKNQTLNNDNISQASLNENMEYHNQSEVLIIITKF
jgi:hypothetical protein